MKSDLRDIFVDKLKIESKVTAIDSIFGNEDRVNKTIYNPPYQRNYVWDAEKATYFIESILIGTEIPPIVYFRKIGSLEIIDGRQRYETISRFMKGSLRLKKSGLKKLDSLNIENLSFKELPIDMQNDFLETKIRIIEFSLPSVYIEMEDAVKQEIFKRYNSGITPLKPTEIDKAAYLEDNLNDYFKTRLLNSNFGLLFNDLFKFDKSNNEILLKKIRQLLVQHRVPIKYYSVAKQKVLDKYYELLVSNLPEDDYDSTYSKFMLKLNVIKQVKVSLESDNIEYNRLYSECLFWGLSVIEENSPYILNQFGDLDILSIVKEFEQHQDAFKMERSSFAKALIGRYKVVADLFSEVYDVDFSNYINNNDDFRKENKGLSKTISKEIPKLEDLRINKPEPATNTIEDICRLMQRNRFLIRPPYQREEVINQNKSSEIIESLLLGIKLPPIFLYKRKDGICEVIDGQQRLLSILAFIGKEYMDEKGNMVKSKKDGFALRLKDGILSNLDKNKFSDLDEESKDKILNFDLWTIEIQEKYNPDFEAIDLFIRLNNKPFPIKDDTFEMWNSYIDRDIIETIKFVREKNQNWFYLRKKSTRMENDNLITVLSFFEYQNMMHFHDKDYTPNAIDIYKTSKINFRLRSKVIISQVLEDITQKEKFLRAVDAFQYGYLYKLRLLLETSYNLKDITLTKALDDILLSENGKRTQQSFYALWYFIHSLSATSIKEKAIELRTDIKQLLKIMSSNIEIDVFKEHLGKIISKYGNDSDNLLMAPLGDIVDILQIEGSTTENCDLYIDTDARILTRLTVSQKELLTTSKKVLGLKIKRYNISSDFLYCILRSSYVYKTLELNHKLVSVGSLSSLNIPLVDDERETVFENFYLYLQSEISEQQLFYYKLCDKMIEELYFSEEYHRQKFSIINRIKSDFPYLDRNDISIDSVINATYAEVSAGGSKVLSDFMVASGMTFSFYNSHEKDK